MRKLTLCLVLALIGCSKGQPSDEVPAAPAANVLSAPSTCTQTQSGAAHDFLEWGVLSADVYDCPDVTNMSCTLALNESDGRREMVCLKAGAPIMPASCVHAGQGTHDYLDGTEAFVDGYDCGVWHNNIRCFYYVSAGRAEMRCLDNQLPF